MTTPTINYPRAVSRAEWLQERTALLADEKNFTHARDRLNARRRELPMVRIDEPYVFDSATGRRSLLDLFEGRLQLFVYHFMWRWEKGEPLDEPCRGCSGWGDQIARGHLNALHHRHTTLALISRAPMSKIAPFKQRMGWTLPWYSSFGSRFNFDFNVSFDAQTAPMVYNYRTRAEHQAHGTDYYFEAEPPFDLHGLSCFLRKGDQVFHTYSSYGRGAEEVGGSSFFMDLTALGRQEEWEEPKGRIVNSGVPQRPDLNPYPDEQIEKVG